MTCRLKVSREFCYPSLVGQWEVRQVDQEISVSVCVEGRSMSLQL